MQTYTEYLNTMTVKALNAICKAGGYKGYSKLRKAALIAFIEGEIDQDFDGASQVKILSTEVTADHDKIIALMAEFVPAPIILTPVTPAESEPETSDTEELVSAYRHMRATAHKLGNVPARVRIVGKLRTLSATLKARGVTAALL